MAGREGDGRGSRLQPCAECGGKGKFQRLKQADQALTTIVCDDCGARTPVLPVDEAVSAWNDGGTGRAPAADRTPRDDRLYRKPRRSSRLNDS